MQQFPNFLRNNQIVQVQHYKKKAAPRKVVTKENKKQDIKPQNKSIVEDAFNESDLRFESVYKCFTNFKILKDVLKFLEIKDLMRCSLLNMKIRLMIKWFFQYTSFEESIFQLESQKKDKAHLIVKAQYDRRVAISNNVQDGLMKYFSKLSNITDGFQLKLLQTVLSVNGHENISTSNVIRYILDIGFQQCFQEIFQMKLQKIKQKLPELKFISHQIPQINSLMKVLYSYIQDKSINQISLKKQLPYMKKYQKLYYMKVFENIKPKIIQTFRQKNMSKANNLYQFSNKNIFNRIILFLNFKEILNLKNSSKYLSTYVDLSIQSKINNLTQKRELLLNTYDICPSKLQVLENYSHIEYFFNNTNGTFTNSILQIPICKQLLEQLISINIPSLPLNTKAYVYILKNNFFQINKQKEFLNDLQQFLASTNVEKIEQEIRSYGNKVQSKVIYFSFLYKYLECIHETFSKKLNQVFIKEEYKRYNQYIHSTQQEIYYFQKMTHQTDKRVPIYFKDTYPKPINCGYKGASFNVFG